MKWTPLSMLAMFACGGPAAVAPPAVARPKPKTASAPHESAAPNADDRSWISPGPIQLELGGMPIQPEREGEPIEVAVLDDQGSTMHVTMRLPTVRFAAWVERARMFAIITRDTRVTARDGSDFQPATTGEPIEATLKAGARVRRLAHQTGWSRVRYFGALEIEGWVPDHALADRGPTHDAGSLRARGAMVQTVLPGSVIRSETRWAAHALATTANSYFVDKLGDVDDSWMDVVYEDGDVKVHGFVSKHDPPGPLHRPPEAENAATIAPNGKLVAGTCLYARAGGASVGSVVGETPAEIAPGTRADWFDVAIDTPWGPITFAATGASETELAPCATSP